MPTNPSSTIETAPVTAELQHIADDVRALFQATADVADEHVVAARKRLATALTEAGHKLDSATSDIRERATAGAKAVDGCVRTHPYESLAIAFGLGAIIGFLAARR